MSDIYHLDYETRSASDLTEVGTWRYAMDPTTEVMCAAIGKNDDPVLIWIPPQFECEGDMGLTAPVRSDKGALDLLLEMLDSVGPIYAHNAMFEIAITECVLMPLLGSMPHIWLNKLNRKRWRCTAAMSRRANIPASLEMSAAALHVDAQKDKGGKTLIRLFSVPQKKLDGAFASPQNNVSEFAKFVDYCKQDVRAEKGVHKVLHQFELTGWLLDTFHEDIEINARGLPVNLGSLAQANSIIEVETKLAEAEFSRLTGGIGVNQRAVFKAWLEANGLKTPNMQAATVDALIDSGDLEGTGVAGEALQLKRKIAYAAIKKVPAMIACAGPHDNKVRGSQQFYGAQCTGRWSGRGIQPHNFKRPEFEETQEAYAYLQAGASKEVLEFWYGRPIFSILASCIRHFIHDDKGPMISGDYTAIEACVLAWLAGEEWKIDVFNGDGRIYEAAGCRMFGMTMAEFDEHTARTGKNHPMRQKSKVGELACGYQGGVGALTKMCEQSRVNIPPEDMQGIVDSWREANPAIVSFWWDCDRAVKNAIRFPGRKFTVRKVSFFTLHAAGSNYLFTVLPSGRRLAYRDPRIEVETVRTYNDDGDPFEFLPEDSGATFTEKTREHISYHGNVKGNLWGSVNLYGGKIVENITQAVAFDLMANGVLKVSAKGFPIYLLIHDEILSGFDPAKHSLETFQAAMVDAPAWAAGLPLKAKCELVPFYMK